jgi:phosphoglucomutase
VTAIKDYKLQVSKDLVGKKEDAITGMPESNVLQLFIGDAAKISIRPSGTEPKIKFYFGLNTPLGKSESDTKTMLEERYKKVSDELFKRCGLE